VSTVVARIEDAGLVASDTLGFARGEGPHEDSALGRCLTATGATTLVTPSSFIGAAIAILIRTVARLRGADSIERRVITVGATERIADHRRSNTLAGVAPSRRVVAHRRTQPVAHLHGALGRQRLSRGSSREAFGAASPTALFQGGRGPAEWHASGTLAGAAEAVASRTAVIVASTSSRVGSAAVLGWRIRKASRNAHFEAAGPGIAARVDSGDFITLRWKGHPSICDVATLLDQFRVIGALTLGSTRVADLTKATIGIAALLDDAIGRPDAIAAGARTLEIVGARALTHSHSTPLGIGYASRSWLADLTTHGSPVAITRLSLPPR
jgi:hypothetical protein